MTPRQSTLFVLALFILAEATVLPLAWIAVTSSFETEPVGDIPETFESVADRRGRPGTWVVRVQDGAPSRTHVLVQEDATGADNHFALAIASAPAGRHREHAWQADERQHRPADRLGGALPRPISSRTRPALSPH